MVQRQTARRKANRRIHLEFKVITNANFTVDVVDQASESVLLRRTIKIESPRARNDLRFRIGSGASIDAVAEDVFRIGDQLTLRIEGGSGQIEETDTGQQLFIPLDLVEGMTTLLIEYAW